MVFRIETGLVSVCRQNNLNLTTTRKQQLDKGKKVNVVLSPQCYVRLKDVGAFVKFLNAIWDCDILPCE